MFGGVAIGKVLCCAPGKLGNCIRGDNCRVCFFPTRLGQGVGWFWSLLVFFIARHYSWSIGRRLSSRDEEATKACTGLRFCESFGPGRDPASIGGT